MIAKGILLNLEQRLLTVLTTKTKLLLSIPTILEYIIVVMFKINMLNRYENLSPIMKMFYKNKL